MSIFLNTPEVLKVKEKTINIPLKVMGEYRIEEDGDVYHIKKDGIFVAAAYELRIANVIKNVLESGEANSYLITFSVRTLGVITESNKTALITDFLVINSKHCKRLGLDCTFFYDLDHAAGILTVSSVIYGDKSGQHKDDLKRIFKRALNALITERVLRK
jgi:hypothetical protein